MYKLIIVDKEDLCYLKNNIEKFKNVEYLYIYKVKLNDFSFLSKMKKLRILELEYNKKINYDSLFKTLNENPLIKHLYIVNNRLKKIPPSINKLQHLESLGLIDTKIRKLNITLNLT